MTVGFGAARCLTSLPWSSMTLHDKSHDYIKRVHCEKNGIQGRVEMLSLWHNVDRFAERWKKHRVMSNSEADCGSPSERDAAESECVRQSGDMEKSLNGSQTWKFRYERHPPERQKDSQHKEEQKTRRLNREGRLVTFYRNGDPFFAGLKTSVSQKSFLTIETLLKWLNSKIPTTAGIYYIFSLPDGHDVQKLADFRGGGSYVVSSTKTLIHVDYGLAPNNKGTRKGSKAQTGPAQKAKNYVQQSTSGSYPASKPRLITVISNSNREMREKLILNPKTTQNFEDLPLLKGQPVRALFTSNPPHVKVESYSQLFREFKDHTTFIACGDELLPFEVTSQIFSRSMSDDGDFAAGQAENPTGKAAVQKQFRAPEGLSRSLAANEAEDKNKTRSSLTEPATDRLYVKGSGAVRVEIQGVVKELFPPTVAEAVDDGGKPAKKLELEWVYGYKWRNIKHNLEVFSTTGELVYCVGTVVIFCNKNNEAQRHYQGHNEDVTCLAIHPNQDYFATAQKMGANIENGAHIRIWHGETFITIAIIGLGTFTNAVQSISFSIQSKGRFLQSVEDGQQHLLRVWDWNNDRLIAETATSNDAVLESGFHLHDDTLLVTVGEQHIYFWKLFWDPFKECRGHLLRDTKSGISKEKFPQFFTAVAFSFLGDVIAGDTGGFLTIWSQHDSSEGENDAFSVNKQCAENLRVPHKAGISALCMLQDGTLLSAGGNQIKAWDSMNDYRLVNESVLSDLYGDVCCVIPESGTGTGGELFVSTSNGYVLKGSLQQAFSPVIEGHSHSVSATAVLPVDQSSFISVGLDQMVIRWLADSHKVLWKVNVEKPCLAVTTDTEGSIVVVGTSVGRLIVLNSEDGMHITSTQVCRGPIGCLSFSPNGYFLAVSSDDGKAHVHEVMYDGHYYYRIGTLESHNTPVIHMDWSADNRYLRTESTDHMLQHWNIEVMGKVKLPRVMRDVGWHTQTCTIAYNILGPWSNIEQTDDLNVLGQSGRKECIAVGDNKGRIRIYSYPCSCYKAEFQEEKHCSSEVTSVQFLMADGALVTSSGTSLVQWSVEDSEQL